MKEYIVSIENEHSHALDVCSKKELIRCKDCILHKSLYCFMYPALDYTNDYDYCSYFSKAEKEGEKNETD